MKFYVFLVGVCSSFFSYSNDITSSDSDVFFTQNNKLYISATYKIKLTPKYNNYSVLLSEKFSNNIKDIVVEQYEGDNEIKTKKLIPSKSGFENYLSHLCKHNIKISVVLDKGSDAFVGKCTNDNPLTLDSGYVFSDLNSLVIILPDNTNLSSRSFSKGVFTIGIDSVSEPIDTIWRITSPVNLVHSIENSINIKDDENFILKHNLYLSNNEFEFNLNGVFINKNEKVIIEKEKVLPIFKSSSSITMALTKKALAFYANHKVYLSNNKQYDIIKQNGEIINDFYMDTKNPLSIVSVDKIIDLSYKDMLKEDLSNEVIDRVTDMNKNLGYFDKNDLVVNKVLITIENKNKSNLELQFDIKEDDNILLHSEYSKLFLLPNEKYSFNIYTINSKFNK
jgi:hypothetical protein